MKERIKLNDTIPSMIEKMSEGNPGAITVCIKLLNEGNDIDKDSALGGLGTILSLDTFNIFGSQI